MKNLEIIKKIIEEFFKKTGFEVIIESLSKKDKIITANLKIEEPQILIGENGQTLNEIQYLLKIILKKQIKDRLEEHFYFNIDINDYKKKKIERLKETALITADEVSLIKKEKELAPMPAYERRIIHLFLTERQDITTKSIGERDERRVVIRPKT